MTKLQEDFLAVLYSILHIKLKIFERAFQRHIICVILTNNEGDMVFRKSARRVTETRKIATPRRYFEKMTREVAKTLRKGPNYPNLT